MCCHRVAKSRHAEPHAHLHHKQFQLLGSSFLSALLATATFIVSGIYDDGIEILLVVSCI